MVYARGSPKIWLPIRLIFHVFFLNILGITKKLDDLGFPMSFFCVYEVNIKNLHDLLVGGLEQAVGPELPSSGVRPTRLIAGRF